MRRGNKKAGGGGGGGVGGMPLQETGDTDGKEEEKDIQS